MTSNSAWTRQQLLVAFSLYCRLPFGRLHQRNPEIIKFAEAIGRSPSAMAMKLTNIASLDPAITSTGRTGLRQASSADRQLWREMHDDWGKFAVESEQAIRELGELSKLESDISPGPSFEQIGEERTTLASVRVGQQFFRSTVLSAYGGQCCISGLSIPSLLQVGHIVPWHRDERNRVNPRNGLALSVLHHAAFDAGIITINDDMTVRVSQTYAKRNDEFFSATIDIYNRQPIQMPEKFAPSGDFLSYHRNHIFRE